MKRIVLKGDANARESFLFSQGLIVSVKTDAKTILFYRFEDKKDDHAQGIEVVSLMPFFSHKCTFEVQSLRLEGDCFVARPSKKATGSGIVFFPLGEGILHFELAEGHIPVALDCNGNVWLETRGEKDQKRHLCLHRRRLDSPGLLKKELEVSSVMWPSAWVHSGGTVVHNIPDRGLFLGDQLVSASTGKMDQQKSCWRGDRLYIFSEFDGWWMWVDVKTKKSNWGRTVFIATESAPMIVGETHVIIYNEQKLSAIGLSESAPEILCSYSPFPNGTEVVFGDERARVFLPTVSEHARNMVVYDFAPVHKINDTNVTVSSEGIIRIPIGDSFIFKDIADVVNDGGTAKAGNLKLKGRADEWLKIKSAITKPENKGKTAAVLRKIIAEQLSK